MQRKKKKFVWGNLRNVQKICGVKKFVGGVRTIAGPSLGPHRG
jgi:hypothetical protein